MRSSADSDAAASFCAGFTRTGAIEGSEIADDDTPLSISGTEATMAGDGKDVSSVCIGCGGRTGTFGTLGSGIPLSVTGPPMPPPCTART